MIKDVTAWTEKVCKAIDKLTLEARIMDSNIPKSEAEWWAHKEITDLRARCEKAEKDAERWRQWVSLQTGDVMSLVMDAERYAYILDCDYKSAKQYLPGLNEEEFKAKRTKAHDAAIAKERTA